MTPAPRVSVVVATKDRSARLRALLGSLRAQTLDPADFEVLVVDDGSGDGTRDVLDAEQAAGGVDLRVIGRERSEGPAVARNQGWRAARAEVVAFTDDDCEATPGWLEQGLAACPSGGFAQGPVAPLPRERHELGPFSRTLRVTSRGPYYQTCNMFYSRSLLEQLGGFDERYPKPGGEDTDLAWRGIELGIEPGFAEEALVYHAVSKLGPGGHLRLALRWSDSMAVYGRHPDLRREVFTCGIFWKASHALLAQAALALALGRALPPARYLAFPYLSHLLRFRCRSANASRIWLPYFVLHDVVETYAAARGGIRHRVTVL